MSHNYDMIVMGDINLDWVAKEPLPFALSELTVNGKIAWSPIEKKLGGSGFNFAHFAQTFGYHPLLLAKIGSDLEGKFIYSQLQSHNLEQGVIQGLQESTGMAWIVRDSHGIRFLVNNENNANQTLSISDIQNFAGILASCRILYVSGYCFMNFDKPRTEATKEAMRLARESPETRIVFDVVPHEFYKIKQYSAFTEFQNLTSCVDILISEVATIRRFLELGNKEEVVTLDIALETAQYLKPIYKQFMLRWGVSGCDEQLVWDSDRQLQTHMQTGHENVQDKRGFGDQLALKTLKEFYHL